MHRWSIKLLKFSENTDIIKYTQNNVTYDLNSIKVILKAKMQLD